MRHRGGPLICHVEHVILDKQAGVAGDQSFLYETDTLLEIAAIQGGAPDWQFI